MGLRHALVISGPSDPALPVDEVDWNAEHVIDDFLDFPAIATPAAPASNVVRLFGRNVGGRILPAIRGPSGIDTSLQPFLGRNKVAMFNVAGNGGVDTQFGLAVTATGTAQTTNVVTTSTLGYFRRREWAITTAAATAVAGIRGPAQMFGVGGTAAGRGGFFLVWRWGIGRGATVATHRAFCGMRAAAAAPTDVNPSTLLNMCGMGYDSADAQIQFIHNAGGTATKIPLGTSFPKPTVNDATMYEIVMFSPPGSTQSVSYLITDLISGATASGVITTNLPTTATLLNLDSYVSVGGTSSTIGIVNSGFYLETDN